MTRRQQQRIQHLGELQLCLTRAFDAYIAECNETLARLPLGAQREIWEIEIDIQHRHGQSMTRQVQTWLDEAGAATP
ncbi:hypothetical protein [Caldilinea sp.]|uniref:hypothetical protein n=1 Tax=Caldilinea sp. TaxID=2293560 RepID=UPI002BA6A387|nr:hypothetical protein [Anaerolineales bacterium]HQY92758.1 hypothetical protein [Caldilinea sp.]